MNKGETITIKGTDGSFSGYLAKPSGGKGPGLVIIQEIFGVNKVMRDITEGFAAQGYVALCPDLFWRIEPGIDITDKTQAEWAKAFDLFGKFDVDKGVTDISSAITTLRPLTTGKIGAVGYCLGGLLAYLTATRTNVDASVGYYGVNIQNFLGEAHKIKKPLILHVANKDEFVSPEAQQTIKDNFKGNPHITIHLYADQDHAFARINGKHYNEKAAATANARTLALFNQQLAST